MYLLSTLDQYIYCYMFAKLLFCEYWDEIAFVVVSWQLRAFKSRVKLKRLYSRLRMLP